MSLPLLCPQWGSLDVAVARTLHLPRAQAIVDEAIETSLGHQAAQVRRRGKFGHGLRLGLKMGQWCMAGRLLARLDGHGS